MNIAIVILNWNGRDLLERFLPSVVEFSKEATLYVVDNASSDDSVAYLKAHFPSVKVIVHTQNWGFAEGYNRALFSLEEELLVLLNSDVEVTKGWLSPLLNHFEKHPDTAIAQPKIRDYKRKTHFEYAGAAGGFVDRFGFPFCRGRVMNTLEQDQGQYDKDGPVFWASGACLVIRNAVYRELGGMDALYFAHQEEIDLCWRAHNLGYQSFYLYQSTVYHLGGATLSVMSPQKTFLNFRNSLFNLVKNAPGRMLFGIILVRLCLDGCAGIKFILDGKISHTWAVVRAHFSFYAHLRTLYHRRKQFPEKRKYAALRSVVWQYYVRKRKKFTDLRGSLW